VDTTGLEPDIITAIENARAKVQQQPRSGAAWGKLALVLLAHNFETDAKVCLAHAERLEPKDSRWSYFQGRVAQLRDPEAALPFLRRAAALARDTTMPRLHLAEILLSQGHGEEAATEFETVLQVEPNNPRAHLGLGRLAYQRGDLDTSLVHLTRAAAAVPNLRATHAVLAEIHHRRGDRQAEDRHLALLASSRDLEWPDPYLLEVSHQRAGSAGRIAQAQELAEQGRQQEAVEVLRGAVRDYPHVYLPRLLLAQQLLQGGDLVEAERQLRVALQLRPDSFEALGGLGLVLQRQGLHREAAKYYERTIVLHPGHALAHFNLANCRNELGDRAGAVASLRTAVRVKPEFAWAYRVLGRLLDQMDQPAEAAEHLQQALRLAPGDTEAKDLLERVRDQLARAGKSVGK
jgi:tetratricopeptide (TPR) repeat protein